MSDGVVKYGQQYDPLLDAVIPFTEQVMDYSGPATARITGIEGQVRTDQNPTDRDAATVRVFDVSGAQTALDAVDERTNEFVDLTNDLPPILRTLTPVLTQSTGNGASRHPAAWSYATSAGTSVSLSLNPRSQAQASAAMVADLVVLSVCIPAEEEVGEIPLGIMESKFSLTISPRLKRNSVSL